MSVRRTLLLASVFSMGAAALAPSQSFAQAAPSAGPQVDALEEVVVTARRREESLQDVPQAITVLSGDAIADRGVASPQDLVTLTPGMQVYTRAGGTVYSVRGQSSSAGGSSAGVVIYFADVPGFTSQFFDLENVQVLKGPQGTLFGRVSSGGAILYSPEKPTETYQGFVTGRAGSFNNREVQFGVGGPLIEDKLMFRVAGRMRDMDGPFHSGFNDRDFGGVDDNAIRASVLFRPTDNIENLTTYQIQQRKPGPQPLILTAVNPAFAANNIPVAPQVAAQYGLACTGPLGRCPTWTQVLQGELAAQQGRSRHDIYSGSEVANATRDEVLVNTTTWEAADWLTIKNIASLSKSRIFGNGKIYSAGTSLPFSFSYAVDPSTEQEGVTEELQFQGESFDDKLQWTVGGFYEKGEQPIFSQTASVSKGGYTSTLLSAGACAAPGVSDGLYCHRPGTNTVRVSRSKTRDITKAIFGQATWAVTDQFNITGGLRYTSDESRFQGYSAAVAQSILAPVTDATVAPTGPLITINSEGDATTYTLSADYRFDADTLVYATTRTGHKAGGFNTQAPPAERTFDPEKITDYEIGLKKDFSLGSMRARADISLYYDKYEDIQVTSLGNAGGVLYPVTLNAAAGEIKGVDLEGLLIANDWLRISGFYSYTDSEFTELPASTVLVKNVLPYISEQRWGLSPTIELAGINAAWPDVTIAPKAYYQSEYYNLATDLEQRIPARTLYDVRVDWKPAAAEGLTLALVVQNLTDEESLEYYSAQYTQAGQSTATVIQPRTWYLEASYKF